MIYLENNVDLNLNISEDHVQEWQEDDRQDCDCHQSWCKLDLYLIDIEYI